MCQISGKIHGKSFGNSRTTLTLFRGAVLMPRSYKLFILPCANANEEISEQRIFATLSQDSRQSMSTT